MKEHTSPKLQDAIAYFTEKQLLRLLSELRQKYIDLGHTGGYVTLENSTANERSEVATLLGKPLVTTSKLKISLQAFDAALQNTRFACTLPELLAAAFPDQPLITKKEKRARKADQQHEFYTKLQELAAELPSGTPGHQWLVHGAYGLSWLFARYKQTVVADETQQEKILVTIRYVAEALNQLPEPGNVERLALFAQRTSGDPHALDRDREAGRLFLYALLALASSKTASLSISQHSSLPSSLTLQDSESRYLLYANAGLLLDTISSSVAVFNLVGAISFNGAPDPLLEAAGERVLLLPLRQLLAWQSVCAAQADSYVVENPQVFEEIVARLSTHKGDSGKHPTVICTSGWPSSAALKLLDLLLAQSPHNQLHYSGDFDLKGLQIASYLLHRYAERCRPWRFDPASYTIALQTDGTSFQASELQALLRLPAIFAPLVAAMQQQGKWAYQEGITHLLAEDISNRTLPA